MGKITIKSGDLEYCIHQVTQVLPKNFFFDYKPAKKIFKKNIEGFIKNNKDRYSAKGSTLETFEEDAVGRFSDYYKQVNHYVEEDLAGPLDMISRDLRDAGIDYEDCQKIFIDIRAITRNFLLEIFITNQVENFEKIIEENLWVKQWPAKIKMPHLRRKSAALYDKFLEILKENLSVLREVYMNLEPAVKDSVYRTALGKLFDTLEERADLIKTDKLTETFVDEQHPEYIFKDRASFLHFVYINAHFVLSVSDLAFVYRTFEKEKRIIAKDTPFREWYNGWPDRKFEVENYFKTLAHVGTTSRKNRYKLVIKDWAPVSDQDNL